MAGTGSAGVMSAAKVQALLREGAAFHQRNRLAEAAQAYATVRALAPAEFEAWHRGGLVALLAGQTAEAARLLEEAVRLKPKQVHAAFGLGVARIALGQAAAAEEVLRRVTANDPKQVEAWHYRAIALEALGRTEEAVAAHRRVVALKPDFAPGWQALGVALSSVGSPSEAMRCFERVLKQQPQNVRARLGRAMMLYKSHRVAEAADEMAAVTRMDPRQFEARSYRLVALNSLEVGREELFAEHVAFGETWPQVDPRSLLRDPRSERRLRVALLSPDLREHSVAYFLEPLLRHLDREAFEILLYHDHATQDAVTARLRALADGWRQVGGQADDVVESTIRGDAPDILIELAGHTGGNRLPLLARRLAPVQVTYLGYPNTTGVRTMDFRLVDELTDPESAAAFHTETLVRFAPTAWAYLAPEDAPEPAEPPCVKNGYVTFGSFNNFTKATDRMLREWARLLAAVPDSRLLIKTGGVDEPGIREPIVRRLEAAGFDLGRVELLPRTRDTASHLALYGRVDVALDTFPYHGTTTTCEALWMGVPVVSLIGDRHASRVGLSLLTAAGHPEWAAREADEYGRIACALAGDRTRLVALRRQLRADVAASPLGDHAGQAARFGAALRACWRQRCGAPADSGLFTPNLEPLVL